MRYSFSATSTWWECPFKYKLRYLDKLKTKPDLRPDNPLMEGTAMHEAIEKRSINEGINNYKSNFPVLTKEHDIEIYKMEQLMKKAIEQIPEGEYEFKLVTDDFIGYIDGLVEVEDGVYDLYDFKFTASSPSKYLKSGQIHLYKYYYEHLTGNKIRDMYYAIVPKCTEKLTEDLSEEDLKEKINKWMSKKDIQFIKVDYDEKQVRWFFARKALIEKATSFEKRYSLTCRWCEYAKYCKTNGKDRSELVEEMIEPVVEEVALF